MSRVLIADDMVPDRGLTSVEEVRAHYSRLYPGEDFADGAAFVYGLLNLLRSEGYTVDLANTPAQASRLVGSKTYDVIVLDLGWWTIKGMSHEEKMVLGFKMADEIRAKSSAQILMFSNRFFKDERLARTAAEKGCLPVFKSYNDVSAESILVTIRWASFRKNHDEALRGDRKLFDLGMYKRLSRVLLGSIILAAVLLFFAVPIAVFQQTRVSIVASIFGTVTTFLNGAIYWYVNAFRKSAS